MAKMGISDHKTNKMPLYETIIYKQFKGWSGEHLKLELEELKKRIDNVEEGTYKKELQKEYRQRDFLRIFIVMCELARENFGEGKKKDTLKDFVMNVIGGVIGDIILETNNIETLNRILSDLEKRHHDEFMHCVEDRRAGKVWILDHKSISETIENVLQKQKEKEMGEVSEKCKYLTFGDYAKYNFAMFSGVSRTEVESTLARVISRTYLHSILYGQIMRMILMDAFGNDLYLSWYGDEDLFTGYSGVKHFFDGIIILEEEDRENPWLLKCISTYNNPLDAVESVDAKLDDIGVKKSILFVPMYPTQNTLRYSVYAYSEKKHEILVLYLHDLYEMLGLEGNKIKGYLRGKRIR